MNSEQVMIESLRLKIADRQPAVAKSHKHQVPLMMLISACILCFIGGCWFGKWNVERQINPLLDATASQVNQLIVEYTRAKTELKKCR